MKNPIKIKTYKNYEIEYKAGFRASRTCMYNIFNLSQITETETLIIRETHRLFVQLAEAAVPKNKIWNVFETSTQQKRTHEGIFQTDGQSGNQTIIHSELQEDGGTRGRTGRKTYRQIYGDMDEWQFDEPTNRNKHK